MASTPFVSNAVNGYSRYDVPENVAFSATPGILYVSRCDFMNARDVVHIQAGAVIRANPSVVPTFTPYQVRLHRFFCPMQLYHPEMRVNSSGFDMRSLSLNYGLVSSNISTSPLDPDVASKFGYIHPSSLLQQLGLASGPYRNLASNDTSIAYTRSIPADAQLRMGSYGFNCDPLLAYWDIVRCYYSYSQVQQFSIAVPSPHVAGYSAVYAPGYASTVATAVPIRSIVGEKPSALWHQLYGNLDVLDKFYETSFYPHDGDTRYLNTGASLVASLTQAAFGGNGTVSAVSPLDIYRSVLGDVSSGFSYLWWFNSHYPSAVVPSSPDRLSRLLPAVDSDSVSLSGLTTVTQLALAARLQEYKELLGAGGSRFTDWVMTFFAAKVPHVDRPALLYSSSFYLNSDPIFNQSGAPGEGLGSYGGTLSGISDFGTRSQRYCFDEPGYLMDLVSIRPLYYWSGVQADYAHYDAMDYFNPIFNQVGYQAVPASKFFVRVQDLNSYPDNTVGKEPCYNEFRSSYDRVFGSLALISGYSSAEQPEQIYTSWVMQRNAYDVPYESIVPGQKNFMDSLRFVSLSDVNRPFASNSEDNFFVNVYYRVTRKSLVSKNFVTKLATR